MEENAVLAKGRRRTMQVSAVYHSQQPVLCLYFSKLVVVRN